MWILEGAPGNKTVAIGPFNTKEQAEAFDSKLDGLFRTMGFECSGVDAIELVDPTTFFPKIEAS